MDNTLAFWCLLLTVGMAYWFYANMSMEIDYERHSQLINQKNGLKRKPKELLNLTKVIHYTEQYINSTNAHERLYDLGYQLNMENPFLFDQSYSDKSALDSSGWPVAHQNVCSHQLQWILDQIENNQNYTYLRGQLGFELTKLMDNFGRPESAVFSGIINWLGSYKGCRTTSLNGGKIKTRYCIGRMRAKSWPQDELPNLSTSIRVGMCLPESCDTNSLSTQHEKIEKLVKLELPPLYKDELELKSMFCLPDERSPIRKLPASGHIYLFIVAAWLALVISASVTCEVVKANRRNKFQIIEGSLFKQVNNASNYKNMAPQYRLSIVNGRENEPDFGITRRWSQLVLEALSIRESLKAFKTNSFRIRYNQGHRVRVNLCPLDTFKVLMCLLVILGHSGYLVNIYSRSLRARIEALTSDDAMMVVSISKAVDLFFVFFGVLTSYTLMRKLNMKQLANPLIWVGINLGIFLRIGPLFMLVYWYSRTVSPYTGSGPWWDYGVDRWSMKGVCMRDPWWKSIPYFGSLGNPPVPTCVLPGWFLVSYSQISLLLPLITYIIIKLSKVQRCILVACLSVVSTSSLGYRLYTQTTVSSEAFMEYGGFLSNLLEKFESTGHMTTLGRVGCVAVGCLVGCLSRAYETGQIEKWPEWVCKKSTLLWCILFDACVVLLPLVGKKVYQATGHASSMETIVITNGIISFLFPMVNSILLINATTTYNHKVLMRFLSHSFWHSFNRLGLCIYLVHWEVLFITITSYEQSPSYLFYMDVVKMWSVGIFLSTVLAFFIHILIESPLARLLNVASKLFESKSSSESSIHDNKQVVKEPLKQEPDLR